MPDTPPTVVCWLHNVPSPQPHHHLLSMPFPSHHRAWNAYRVPVCLFYLDIRSTRIFSRCFYSVFVCLCRSVLFRTARDRDRQCCSSSSSSSGVIIGWKWMHFYSRWWLLPCSAIARPYTHTNTSASDCVDLRRMVTVCDGGGLGRHVGLTSTDDIGVVLVWRRTNTTRDQIHQNKVSDSSEANKYLKGKRKMILILIT